MTHANNPTIQQSNNSFVEAASSWLVVATAFILPLFFLSFTIDAFELPKFALLLVVTSLLVLIWLARMIIYKEVVVVVNPFLLPLFLFTLAYITSLFVSSPNKIQPLITPGSSGSIIVLFVFFFLLSIISYQQEKLINGVKTALTLSSVALSVITVLVSGGLLKNLPLPDLLKLSTFTPSGSPLIFLTFAIIVLVTTGGSLFLRLFVFQDNRKRKLAEMPLNQDGEKQYLSYLLPVVSSIIILIAIGLTVYQLTNQAKPILLPYSAGWQIAVEGLKEVKTALFGVGPGNFVNAFTQFKPIFLNNTDLWNLRFAVSSNYFLFLLTEAGLLTFVIFVFFLMQTVRVCLSVLPDPYHPLYSYALGLLAIFIINLFLPTNMILLFLLFTLAAILGSNTAPVYTIKERSKILPLVLTLVVLLLLLPTLYLAGRAYAAELIFKQAIDDIRLDNAQPAYDKSFKAISLNPFVDIYHVSYSELNLALARNLSNQEEVDEQGRSLIAQLIQQAITHAKSAVAANPQKASNWENLANTYRSIMNIAEGADNWTIEVYSQTIRLDPVNPLLRMDLGGVFYSLARFDDAINQFQLAVSLKPDLVNGYYNLAWAYRQKEDLENAILAMRQVVSNLPFDHPDSDKAKKELANLEQRLPDIAEATTTGELLSPPELPETILEPPLELPLESAPPAIEETTPPLEPSE